jgi:hypothetical protein
MKQAVTIRCVWLAKTGESTAIGHEDVGPAVGIVIEYGYTAHRGFRDVMFSGRAVSRYHFERAGRKLDWRRTGIRCSGGVDGDAAQGCCCRGNGRRGVIGLAPEARDYLSLPGQNRLRPVQDIPRIIYPALADKKLCVVQPGQLITGGYSLVVFRFRFFRMSLAIEINCHLVDIFRALRRRLIRDHLSQFFLFARREHLHRRYAQDKQYKERKQQIDEDLLRSRLHERCRFRGLRNHYDAPVTVSKRLVPRGLRPSCGRTP